MQLDNQTSPDQTLGSSDPARPERRAQNTFKLVNLIVAFCIVALQAQLFTTGFRLSHDELYWHYLFLQGYDGLIEYSAEVAAIHGRVGLYLVLPLNAVAANLSEWYAFRIFTVALHFWTMYLAASFASCILRRDIKLLMFVVLVILHPLDFHHLPPNAYPLQNSVPFILVFLSRIWLWGLYDRKTDLPWLRLFIAYFVFSFGMLFNEYATALGATLLLAEHVSLISRSYQQNGSLLRALVRTAVSRRFWLDALFFASTLGIYVLFRVLNPSTYNANSLDGLHRFHETWTTLYLHVFSSTVFTRWDASLLSQIWAPTGVLLLTAIVGVLSFFFFVNVEKPKVRARELIVVIVTCLIIAAVLTLPIAGIIKYQDWCLEGDSCVYLDSRMSIFAVGAIVAVLCLGVFTVASNRNSRAFVTIAISFVLASVSSLTYLTNWKTEQEMEAAVSAWDRASAVACLPSAASADDQTLARLIDPAGRIPVVEGLKGFWRAQVESRRSRLDCDNLPMSILKWSNHVKPGQVLPFADPENYLVLASGWNGPESWGVWSKDEIAEIRLSPSSPRIQALGFKFYLFPPPRTGSFFQSVEVGVNDEVVAVWSYEHDECGARVVELADPLPLNQETTIVFRIDKPTSPKSIGHNEDTRQLGLGLLSMKIADAGDPNLSNWLAEQCR